MLLSDYNTQVRNLVHDSSSIDFTDADLTGFINEARNRVALDFWCVRSYFTGFTTIVNQETYPLSGGCGAKVTAGGLYSAVPTVTFGAPASGTTATGTAVTTGTAPSITVVGIAMTNWGSGYTSTSPPSVTFSAGAPTATATAVVMAPVIDLYTVSYLYPPGLQGSRRQMMLWAPFGTFNAIYRYNTVNSGPPGVWSQYVDQNLFYLYPSAPDQSYPLEMDAFVLPNPLVNLTDSDTQVNAPVNELVQYQASYKALLKTQNFDQADYYDKKYKARAAELQVTRFAPRRSNIYQNVWRRVQRGYA